MTISTHVLDTSVGRPAQGVAIRLQHHEGDRWIDLGEGVTNDDGRAPSLAGADVTLGAGQYRLIFGAGAYFERRGIQSFYGDITIEFIVRDSAAHYHVPLLLSPFAYSTYRGS